MAAPARLLRSGPANKVVSGLLNKSDMAEAGALVGGRDGLLVETPFDPEPPDCGVAPSRVFESQQTEPRSQRLGGLLMTMEGFEQKADIKPGRQTPGQRFNGAAVVVVVVLALVVVVDGRAVVDDPGTLELGDDGRELAGAVAFFCSVDPPVPSRRLMQHLPPLAQTALESMKSHK